MQLLKKIMPYGVFKFLKRQKYKLLLFATYRYKLYRDLRFSNAFNQQKPARLSSLLVKSHVLEKIITMPSRQLGRGQARVREVIASTNEVAVKYGYNSMPVQAAIADLKQYLDIHINGCYKLPDDIENGIKELLPMLTIYDENCYKTTRKEGFRSIVDFADFAHSRHSVRQFANKEVDSDVLFKAVELALTAPSACNRQSSRVKIVQNAEKKKAIAAKIHNGSQGFGENIPVWLLVTSEQGAWSHLDTEQAYIDAGIFTMNILYALHYYGLAACTLNAKLKRKKQQELQQLLGYPCSEMPMVFIAVGWPDETYGVAKSRRYNVREIVSLV